MTERFWGMEHVVEKSKKVTQSLKSVLGELLRNVDLYSTPMRSNFLSLHPTDVPADYNGRDLMDIGSSAGYRYKEIEACFRPKSYVGVDKNSTAVTAGKRRNLDIRQVDFVDEYLEGDLGVMFGTYTTPDVVKKLGEHFNLLVFNVYAADKVRESEIIKEYEGLLGNENFDKIVTHKISSANDVSIDFFYRPKHTKENMTSEP